MNPWQYKHGVCNNVCQFFKKKFLSWQLINSSCATENKPFIQINTAKCGTEDVAWELSHLL